MPRVINLNTINERGGAGAAAVPDTPIAPRVLQYGSLVGHDGAAIDASPPTNGNGVGDPVRIS